MGDMSVLREAKLTYVDEDDFPKNLMEAQNVVIKAKQEFDNFPTELKEKFNNSAEQYISEMGTEDFNKKMAPFNDEMEKLANMKASEEYKARVEEQAAFNKAVNAAMAEGDN